MDKKYKPIFVFGIFVVWFILSMVIVVRAELPIGFPSLSEGNIVKLFFSNCLTSLLPLSVLLCWVFFSEGNLSCIGITRNNLSLVCVLILLYFGNLFIRNGTSAEILYKSFFHLIVVAATEEFFFRGYIYTFLAKSYSELHAGVISGIMWGAIHPIPGIIRDGPLSLMYILNEIFSSLLGPCVAGFMFIYLYRKTKTIFVPILIHAILNTQFG